MLGSPENTEYLDLGLWKLKTFILNSEQSFLDSSSSGVLCLFFILFFWYDGTSIVAETFICSNL